MPRARRATEREERHIGAAPCDGLVGTDRRIGACRRNAPTARGASFGALCTSPPEFPARQYGRSELCQSHHAGGAKWVDPAVLRVGLADEVIDALAQGDEHGSGTWSATSGLTATGISGGPDAADLERRMPEELVREA